MRGMRRGREADKMYNGSPASKESGSFLGTWQGGQPLGPPLPSKGLRSQAGLHGVPNVRMPQGARSRDTLGDSGCVTPMTK